MQLFLYIFVCNLIWNHEKNLPFKYGVNFGHFPGKFPGQFIYPVSFRKKSDK